MVSTMIDETRLKEAMKAALIEVFEEKRDLFYDLVAEVLEDQALFYAIKEGETSESVSRAEVFNILGGDSEG